MLKYDKPNFKIYSQNLNSNKNPMDFYKELDLIVERLKPQIKLLPSRGYFRDFGETLRRDVKPDFFGSSFGLFIERDLNRDGRAFLGVSVLHPQNNHCATSYLMNGNKETILSYLNNPEFKKEVQETVLNLSEALKNKK